MFRKLRPYPYVKRAAVGTQTLRGLIAIIVPFGPTSCQAGRLSVRAARILSNLVDIAAYYMSLQTITKIGPESIERRDLHRCWRRGLSAYHNIGQNEQTPPVG